MCSPLWNFGEPITFPSHQGLHGSDIVKKSPQYYPSNALFALPSYTISSPFSLIISQFFTTFPFFTVSLCLSRASIVQKRIIYFQDEGSLTIRLCEKGNDSCPSILPLTSPLLIFLSLTAHHGAIIPCSICRIFFPPFGAKRLPVFHTVFKKYEASRGSGGKLWGQRINTDFLGI